ncbi:UNVERIFIED_CONTAM: hypothetical protein GTU68_064678 [Idotea baltica]|nr:hypothetical protein [Idotea baltica]
MLIYLSSKEMILKKLY